MLGGRISNQDEEEVEDELAAMEAELQRTKEPTLPSVPNSKLPQREQQHEEEEAEPAGRQAMLAA